MFQIQQYFRLGFCSHRYFQAMSGFSSILFSFQFAIKKTTSEKFDFLRAV